MDMKQTCQCAICCIPELHQTVVTAVSHHGQFEYYFSHLGVMILMVLWRIIWMLFQSFESTNILKLSPTIGDNLNAISAIWEYWYLKFSPSMVVNLLAKSLVVLFGNSNKMMVGVLDFSSFLQPLWAIYEPLNIYVCFRV